MDKRLEVIIATFEKVRSVTIVESLNKQPDGKINGKINLEIEGKSLNFSVDIPVIYPFDGRTPVSAIFACDEIEIYPHHLQNDKICLQTPKSSDLKTRLNLEISLLRKWMKKYFIDEDVDEQAEMLYFQPVATKNGILLYTEVDRRFSRGDFGEFTYLYKQAILSSIYMIEKIGEARCQWTEVLVDSLKPINPIIRQGLFVFLGKLKEGASRKAIRTWKDLERYLTSKQIKHIYSAYKGGVFENTLLLIGYWVGKSNSDIYWHTLYLPIKSPVRKKNNLKSFWMLTDEPITQGATQNLTYQKYFGRGKLDKTITEAKILIVGIGAIGSSLAISLAKGGTHFLDINDFDVVLSGNICRSEYGMANIGMPKNLSLLNQLNNISPFIQVNSGNGFPVLGPNDERKKGVKAELEKYDIIFDCSTDMEVAYLLDSMCLGSTVINISISNGARELACITGNSIADDKSVIFEQLENNELLYYEVEGCAYPTFTASYCDINMLVNFALKNINLKMKNGNLTTFVVKTTETDRNFNLLIEEY